ncbi:MAG: PASTA domain-containing protein, partial [Micromonosporaceae bacterium]|nr:PASTA domain-containing protein [Micromonosporaceae bacterium]
GYSRGAASVPAPPARVDTGHYTAPVAVPSTTGYAGPGRPRGQNNKLLVGALVGVVVILLGLSVGAWALLGNHGGGGTPAGGGGTATQQANSGQPGGGGQPTVETVDVNCNQLVGQQANRVQQQLEQNGFLVQRAQQDGGRQGRVVDINPCGPQPKGTTITLTVASGQNGGGNPTPGCTLPGGLKNPLCPSDNQGPGGGGGPGDGGGGLPSVAPTSSGPLGG